METPTPLMESGPPASPSDLDSSHIFSLSSPSLPCLVPSVLSFHISKDRMPRG